jgi:predicted lipid-binding transport protein (Tim44 family)
MPPIVYDLFSFLGFLLRALGFLVAGLAFGRLVLDSIKGAIWQLQAALLLGLFGLLIALTVFSTPGSAGAFALGAGLAYFWSALPPKSNSKNEKND